MDRWPIRYPRIARDAVAVSSNSCIRLWTGLSSCRTRLRRHHPAPHNILEPCDTRYSRVLCTCLWPLCCSHAQTDQRSRRVCWSERKIRKLCGCFDFTNRITDLRLPFRDVFEELHQRGGQPKAPVVIADRQRCHMAMPVVAVPFGFAHHCQSG